MHFLSFIRRGLIYAILGCLTLAAARAVDVDTDGDGVVDAEELATGTDPNNSQSVALQAIAAWRFTDGTLNGDAGQQPVAQQNVSTTPGGFDGPGASIVPNGANPVVLKYRATELSGKRNIAPIRGSVFLQFKPNWPRCTGPGSWVTLLQTTNFALRIKPDGSALVFTNTATSYSYQIALFKGDCDTYWEYVLFTYSPEETSLSRGAPSTRLVGAGIAPPADINDPNNFISFGSTPDGKEAANGVLDEVIMFNGPGVLSVTPTVISTFASNSPPALNIVWGGPTNGITFIKRRIEGGSTWTPGAALGTNFLDKTVTPGVRYEYNLNTTIADVFYGLPDDVGRYLKASVRGTPLHDRGKVILLVDQTLTNGIKADLDIFTQNLIGDGWQVLRKDVPRHIDNTAGTLFYTNYWNITNYITPFVKSNYALFGSEIKYILAIGHVPIAYTGTTADDGHSGSSPGLPNHTGAWASDLFFGDVDGIWTDSLTVTGSELAANRNYPNDGRLDQNKIPANSSGVAKLEIPVARIDTANLPVFTGDSETQLLIKYLRKNANYRNGLRSFAAETMWWAQPGTTPNGSIPISLTVGGEFSSKISPLKDPIEGDVFRDTRSFVFGIESGAGNFDRINDDTFISPSLHTSADIAAGIQNPASGATGLINTNVLFYFLRGSYFPDFGFTNDFIRAVMCSTNGALAVGGFLGLSWRVDGMGVGQPVGNEMTDVVNAWGKSINSLPISARAMEILGDPTLHYPVQTPPAALNWVVTNNAVNLAWSTVPGASGYFVYRSTNGSSGPFTRLTDELTTTAYRDAAAPSGKVVYMIRSSSTVTSGGGTYTNLSQGLFSRPLSSADPASCCVADQAINEDQGVPAKAFSIGELAEETGLHFTVSSSNPALVPIENVVLGGSGENRTVALTPATNQFGTTVITIQAASDFSTIYKQFTVTVAPVNDAPGFTKGADQIVAQGAGARTVPGWASSISPGPPNEAPQQISFVVTNNNPFLFSVQPAIAANGTLTFTPASSQRGLALVSVQLKDDGGILNGGADTSVVQTFTITAGLPLDTDADGLPDDFELLYGFNPASPGDGVVDWDGDGMTSAQELAAGTDPKDSRSSIRISSAASHSPTFALDFKTAAGKSYAVELNDAFPNSNWQPLAAGIVGTGGTLEQLDESAGSSTRRIYRVLTTGAGGDSIVAEYAGLCRTLCLSNSDTYVSSPFLRPAAEFGAVISVSGNTVQLRGAGSWQVNQWVYNGASQSNTYFLLFRSGPLAGSGFTITANDPDKLTVDLQGSSLDPVQFGDSAAIVPFWTLATFFRGSELSSPSPAVRNSEVLLPDVSSSGTNLSSAAGYYFYDGNWRRVGQGLAPRNDDVILPDMYVMVRQNVGTNVVVTTEGAVLPGRWRIDVRRDATAQDTLAALPRPLAVSLDASGLASSGAFRASSSATSRLDELFFFDNGVSNRNKSAASAYYYLDAWRRIGSGAANRGGDAVFQPGSGTVLRAGAGGASTLWANDATY